jgi:hypothetical protein
MPTLPTNHIGGGFIHPPHLRSHPRHGAGSTNALGSSQAAVLRILAAGYTSFALLAAADPHIIGELCKPCAFYMRKGIALVRLRRTSPRIPGGHGGDFGVATSQRRHVARHCHKSGAKVPIPSCSTVARYRCLLSTRMHGGCPGSRKHLPTAQCPHRPV